VNTIYEIGPFRLDAAAGVMTRSGIPMALGPRAVAVLAALVRHSSEYVQKASIIDAAWPDVVVEEANLAVQISAIRRVLSEAPGGERWVETLPRRGYRFVGPVAQVPEDPAQGADRGTVASNLPEPLTSFVGRERELVELKRLLPGKRLLTLVGVGGIGKTRLAIQLASEVVNAYRDGVRLVEFGLINDPSLVPGSVAQALGVKDTPGIPLIQALCEHLRSRKLLLVLDNCEHLLTACATLVESILRCAADLTIIVTSREALRVVGEQTYTLPALSLPDPNASVDMIGSAESVQLFVERARQQQPGFCLTVDRASAVARLCVRLDGIPLALEFAAARLRSLTLEEIHARLDHRFKLLTDGARTALPRQQTLRATLDWSYGLLSDTEKALLARVSVFAGGWTLDAARRVCILEDVDDWNTLDILTSLVDKSLVLADQRSGATRYRLLETVREYSLDRLREAGQEARWKDRHLAYFVEVAEEAEPYLRTANQQAWLDRLETEHDNFRSALTWSSIAGGEATSGLRLAGVLGWRFWAVRGYLGEGRRWISGLLAAARGPQAAAVRAKALRGAVYLAYLEGDQSAALPFAEESLAIARELGDRKCICDSLHALYFASLGVNDFRSAQEQIEESLAIRRELGDRQGIFDALNNLGVVLYLQGDYSAAQACFEEMLAHGSSDRRVTGHCLINLGNVVLARGDHPGARALYKESLTVRREVGDLHGIAESLDGLAYADLAFGDPGQAALMWGAAERLRERIGARLLSFERPRYDRQVAAARGALGDDAAFDAAWKVGRAMPLEQAIECGLRTSC
jgi:non-specific serine/threonine protein kinase